MEKTVSVPEIVEDLYGLYTELRRKDFAVRNVGSDARGTYVYLEEAEEKDPIPVIHSMVGKPAPRVTLELLEERMKTEKELKAREAEVKAKEAEIKKTERLSVIRRLFRWLRWLYRAAGLWFGRFRCVSTSPPTPRPRGTSMFWPQSGRGGSPFLGRLAAGWWRPAIGQEEGGWPPDVPPEECPQGQMPEIPPEIPQEEQQETQPSPPAAQAPLPAVSEEAKLLGVPTKYLMIGGAGLAAAALVVALVRKT